MDRFKVTLYDVIEHELGGYPYFTIEPKDVPLVELIGHPQAA